MTNETRPPSMVAVNPYLLRLTLLAYFSLLFWLGFPSFFTVSLLLNRQAHLLIAPWQRGTQVRQRGRSLRRNIC